MKKPFEDIWGDAVNVASRMESTGEAGLIQVSEETREPLLDTFILERRGPLGIKEEGADITWMLVRRRPM